MAQTERWESLRVGYPPHEEVRCRSCGRIDLSGGDTLEEARATWNEHVRREHGADLEDAADGDE